tara:strand:- start:451 stop:681 length:231 start_codon:yes stop_codon:yes gene_type:complete
MVMTAGLENPETASSGVKYPRIKRTVKRIIAVTSIENTSVTKRRNPKKSRLNTNTISGVIETNLIQRIRENNSGFN